MRQKRSFERQKEEEKHLINENIQASQVRLIGINGDQLGVLSLREAIAIAEEKGVDVVQVADNANPPVCKLLDYGKLKYREQKKAAEARKKTAVHSTKEIRVRYNTDEHDIETKIRNATKFLEAGDKVRFQMRFRGREIVYRDLGEEMFKQLVEKLEGIATVEESPQLQGNKMMLVFAPKSGK